MMDKWTMRIMFAITIIVLINLIMACENETITDLTVHNHAFDGILYIDSEYKTDLSMGQSKSFIIDPGVHQVDLNSKHIFHKGYVKSEKIIVNQGHNEHSISLCLDCH